MYKIIVVLLAIFVVFDMKAQPLYFPPTSGNTWDTLSPQSLGYCTSKIDSLYAFLAANNTKAFILLKDGKIVLEKYFGTHTQNSPWQWASAGKTITAFLIGVAQKENLLSINDTASAHLGNGWTSCTPLQEQKITIRHQLTMTTGLDDEVPDPFCTLNTCLIYKADAGTRWAYHNAPYTLLDGVIENATGQTLNNYTTQKLKNPTGMTGAFIKIGYNNVFYSNARSMARFGLLILNKGNWAGNQILTDTVYFNQMTNTSQLLNQSYGYLWWLNGKASFMIPSSQIVFPGPLFPNAPADMISAIGKGGQFLNVIPSQKMVWLRMGDEPGNTAVPFLLNNQIWAYINSLNCNPTASHTKEQGDFALKLFPNPANDLIELTSNQNIICLAIYNTLGKVVKSLQPQSKVFSLSVSKWPKGLYTVQATSFDGKILTSKLVVK